jgi:hypothetical protein
MRRRHALIVILLLAVALQAVTLLAVRTAEGFQGATLVTGTELGRGDGIQLYRFSFEQCCTATAPTADHGVIPNERR